MQKIPGLLAKIFGERGKPKQLTDADLKTFIDSVNSSTPMNKEEFSNKFKEQCKKIITADIPQQLIDEIFDISNTMIKIFKKIFADKRNIKKLETNFTKLSQKSSPPQKSPFDSLNYKFGGASNFFSIIPPEYEEEYFKRKKKFGKFISQGDTGIEALEALAAVLGLSSNATFTALNIAVGVGVLSVPVSFGTSLLPLICVAVVIAASPFIMRIGIKEYKRSKLIYELITRKAEVLLNANAVIDVEEIHDDDGNIPPFVEVLNDANDTNANPLPFAKSIGKTKHVSDKSNMPFAVATPARVAQVEDELVGIDEYVRERQEMQENINWIAASEDANRHGRINSKTVSRHIPFRGGRPPSRCKISRKKHKRSHIIKKTKTSKLGICKKTKRRRYTKINS